MNLLQTFEKLVESACRFETFLCDKAKKWSAHFLTGKCVR